MTKGTFEKVQYSDDPMYGPPKLLLCGFAASAQPKFMTVLDMAGLQGIAVVWVNESAAKQPLSVLIDLPDGSGAGEDSALARAIIVSGITENQLHALMTTCRQTGMQQALWAVLTPTSETWPMIRLLTELQAERQALSKSQKKSSP
jgi:hypothetical protein